MSKPEIPHSQLSSLVFVALGSNVGDSRQTFRDVIERFREFSPYKLLEASFWRTTPIDCPPHSPTFWNSVVGFLPPEGETPEKLLSRLQQWEQEFGRLPKKVMNEPRPLDLDLIAFGHETRQTAPLVLPHPRATQRRFVLQPLSEIAPDLILPGQSKSIRFLLADLSTQEALHKVNK